MPALALCAGRATYQPIASSSRTVNKGEFRTSRARFDLGVPLPNHKGFVAYGTLHKARSRLFLSRLFLSLLCHPCFLFFFDPVFLFLCYPFHHGWYKCAARRSFSLVQVSTLAIKSRLWAHPTLIFLSFESSPAEFLCLTARRSLWERGFIVRINFVALLYLPSSSGNITRSIRT